MLYADTFVNKNYLINLDRYPLVELDSAEKSDEYIRLYQIERIVYDVPSTRDEDKERFVQGIEKFIDTMKGSEYTAVFIAEPLDSFSYTFSLS